MKFLCLIVFLSISVDQIFAQENESPKGEKNVVCYYTYWSVWRPGNAKFTASMIDPHMCTHLIYAFATFSNDLGLAPGDENQDIKANGYTSITDLKKQNDKLKVLLAIGGWSEGSARFSTIAGSEEKINHFAQSAIDLLRKYNFDGINIDWQYPGYRKGSKREDFQNYVKLVKVLREAFESEAKTTQRPRLLVTMSVPAEIEYNDQGYDLLNLQRYADFFNIVSYDYHLSYEPNVGHHAPLYPLKREIDGKYNTELNVDATVRYFLKRGVIPEKLNLGIPTFGRTYKLENSDNRDIGAPSKGVGIRGETSKEEGYRTYYEICNSIKNDNWTMVQSNKTALGPYAYKGEDWVGYDDADIVRAKGAYARMKNLGGIMFWTIDDDDFNGNCGSGTFPLIKAGREGILGTILPKSEQAEVTPAETTTSTSPEKTLLNLVNVL